MAKTTPTGEHVNTSTSSKGSDLKSDPSRPLAARGILPAPRLQLVTGENAQKFSPRPNKRGRPRKVEIAGNAVLIYPYMVRRDRRLQQEQAKPELSPSVSAWFGSFLDRINSLPVGNRAEPA